VGVRVDVAVEGAGEGVGAEDVHAAVADEGLSVEELSEAITHLAFYAGWTNAMTAINHLKKLTEEREA
jgi:alkylhydroperoxidase/carboxymuconolactone decarboxylase family protein YurZ